ncbi:MAG: SDR family oxidoreductase [Phycisphaerales bacterium]|nr:MAG: SDR family oxidoreductase [Phycisphaerales bacterium]
MSGPGGRLRGKVVLVTGAARGIGLATAQAAHAEGATVWLSDVRVTEAEDAALALGAGARSVALDVRDDAAWSSAMREVLARDAGLHGLVNNAGITGFETDFPAPGQQDPEHVSLETWRAVLAVNLEGVVLGCAHALRAMRGRGDGGGSIVNVGSRSGVVGVPGACAYAASKAAVAHHTRSVALYSAEAGLGVRCNCVQPSAIRTSMWDAVLGEAGSPGREAREAEAVADCPLRRFGTPAEVAGLIVHLLSDEAGYTTGAVFNVDGGTLAGQASPPSPGAR